MNKVDWSKAAPHMQWYTEDRTGGVFWEREPTWSYSSSAYCWTGENFIDNDPVHYNPCERFIEPRPTEGV